MEVGRRDMDGAKSAVSHGWLFARPTSTITLKMPQAPEGLNSRNNSLGYFSCLKSDSAGRAFLVFSKMKAPGRGVSFARPSSMITFKMPQAPEGLNSRNNSLGYFSCLKSDSAGRAFLVFLKTKAPGKDVMLATRGPGHTARQSVIPWQSTFINHFRFV